MTARPAQTQRLYRAERQVTHRGYEIDGIEIAARYARLVAESDYWLAFYEWANARPKGRPLWGSIDSKRQGPAFAVVWTAGGGRIARGGYWESTGWTVRLPKIQRHEVVGYALCEQVLLHEIAHVAEIRTWNDPGHGPRYAGVYLDLVGLCRGTDARADLEHEFRRGGVRVEYDEGQPRAADFPAVRPMEALGLAESAGVRISKPGNLAPAETDELAAARKAKQERRREEQRRRLAAGQAARAATRDRETATVTRIDGTEPAQGTLF